MIAPQNRTRRQQPVKAGKDLPLREFQKCIKELGFGKAPGLSQFFDLNEPRAPMIEPARNGRTINRVATIEKLQRIRRARLARRAKEDARRAEQARIAASIAPLALPPGPRSPYGRRSRRAACGRLDRHHQPR